MDKCKLSNKDFHNENKKSDIKKINPLFHNGTREVHRLQLVITHKINQKLSYQFDFYRGGKIRKIDRANYIVRSC